MFIYVSFLSDYTFLFNEYQSATIISLRAPPCAMTFQRSFALTAFSLTTFGTKKSMPGWMKLWGLITLYVIVEVSFHERPKLLRYHSLDSASGAMVYLSAASNLYGATYATDVSNVDRVNSIKMAILLFCSMALSTSSSEEFLA